MFQRLEEGILDKIFGIGQVARPAGQPAAGEPSQAFQMTVEQALDCRLISLARARQQLDGRFDRP